MRYIVWALRLIIFVVVLLFALKNTNPVEVGFYGDHVVSGVPLIVVMLVAFVVGIAFALLAVVPATLRRRRELKKTQREVQRLQDSLATREVQGHPDPEPAVPLAPL
jgi:putative membrane protein